MIGNDPIGDHADLDRRLGDLFSGATLDLRVRPDATGSVLARVRRARRRRRTMQVAAPALAAVLVTGAILATEGGRTLGAPAPPAGALSPTATTPAASPSVRATPNPDERTLGDDGIGGLSLGQSERAALATGLVGNLRKDWDVTEACQSRRGREGVQFVYFTHGKVAIIAVGPKIGLASGIGVGDTYKQLHAKYPDANGDDQGKVWLDAPGAKVKAGYRIGINTGTAYPDSKITEIALQANNQACYE